MRKLLNQISRLFSKKSDSTASDLSVILARIPNKEELLGIKETLLPTPRQIRDDAASIVGYTTSQGYKKFADNIWSKVVLGLDKILDDRSSPDLVNYHRASVKTMLDLLRDSYTAKLLMDQYDKENNASLQQSISKVSRPPTGR